MPRSTTARGIALASSREEALEQARSSQLDGAVIDIDFGSGDSLLEMIQEIDSRFLEGWNRQDKPQGK